MSFKALRGVLRTRVGYTGGATAAPTYGSVCGNDGHTEAIQARKCARAHHRASGLWLARRPRQSWQSRQPPETELTRRRVFCGFSACHATAACLQVTFDPDVISYDRILEHFFAEHNPTGGKARACAAFAR